MMVDADVVKTVVDLLNRYLFGNAADDGSGERLDGEHFLQTVFDKGDCDEDVAELFFKILKYEKLLDLVLKDYYRSRKRRIPRKPHDYCMYLVFLYYAIFELSEGTLPKIQHLMMSVNPKKALALSWYMKKPDFLPLLFSWAVHIWDIDYVRNDMLASIRDSIFQDLHKAIQGEIIAEQKSRQKELTVPMEMEMLKSSMKTKGTPDLPSIANGVDVPEEEFVRIKPTPVPKTTYMKPNYVKKLEQDRRRNRENAKQLYEEAQKNMFRVANWSKIEKNEELAMCKKKKPKTLKSRIPTKKEPDIQPKKTAAVILREGARLMKIEQEEIQRLDDIMKGAFHSESLKTLEKEIQEEKIRRHMEEIEKKHIQGLLTYEEALVAKQKYLKRIKEGADEFRKEKENWMKQLEAWKAEEQRRIRESVEKGKAFEKGAKEAVEHVKEEKHRIALETMKESKSLKETWLVEREKELRRKIQLIKEIKALQAFGMIKRKEAVANSTASIGFLCEMSTEELRERLMILRLEVKEEIERRRKEFSQRRECRRAVVDRYRDLIEQHQKIREVKQMNEQAKPKISMKSSSLESLRKKLDDKRRERMQFFTIRKDLNR